MINWSKYKSYTGHNATVDMHYWIWRLHFAPLREAEVYIAMSISTWKARGLTTCNFPTASLD